MRRLPKRLLSLFLFSLLSAASFESIHRGSILKFFAWVSDEPVFFMLSTLLVFLFVGVFSCFSFKTQTLIGWCSAGILSLLSYVSLTKFRLRGDYLNLYDFSLLFEATNMKEQFSIQPSLSFYAGVFGFLSLLFLIIKWPKRNFPLESKRSRWELSLLSLALLCIFSFNLNSIKDYLTGETKGNVHEKQGILLSFASDSSMSGAVGIEGYTKRSVTPIPPIVHDSDVKPNVIVVLSEAFWDATLLPNTTYSRELTPYFNKLAQEFPTSRFTSTVFGGATANPEFEVLTGLSTNLLPTGAIAYNRYIDKPLDALPHLFRENGYRTTAIHSYPAWFYKRDQVYKQLGFQQFLSMEYLNNPTQIGPFLHDKDVFSRTVEEMKKTDSRDFMHVVTMLNHGPYEPSRFQEKTVEADGHYSKKNEETLETFAQSLTLVDESLEQLIEDLNELDEPTLLVYYGDHLPLLGEDYGVYYESGFLKDLDEDYVRMHTTPILIWDNYLTLEERTLPERISPSFVGVEILKRTGIESRNLFALQESWNLADPVTYPKETSLPNGLTKEQWKEYELYQYDALFGERFSYTHTPEADADYLVGSGEFNISATIPDKIEANTPFNQNDGDSILGIEGENFTSSVEVYINGEPVTTSFNSPEYISARIPEEAYRKKGSFTVEIILKDVNKDIIQRSKTYTLQVD